MTDTQTHHRLSEQMKADIARAVAVLKDGGLILYPTDTVWGIGCDATNGDAVRRVYALKGREDSKALITLVGDLAALERVADGIPDVAYDIIEYATRPITIIYDRAIGVSDALTGADGTIGVRLTREAFSNALCRAFRRPLVSTSANISGHPTAKTFADIAPEILNGVDYVCSIGREREAAEPSTVMRLSADGTFKILRP